MMGWNGIYYSDPPVRSEETATAPLYGNEVQSATAWTLELLLLVAMYDECLWKMINQEYADDIDNEFFDIYVSDP